jgi:hypothetical protein
MDKKAWAIIMNKIPVRGRSERSSEEKKVLTLPEMLSPGFKPDRI